MGLAVLRDVSLNLYRALLGGLPPPRFILGSSAPRPLKKDPDDPTALGPNSKLCMYRASPSKTLLNRSRGWLYRDLCTGSGDLFSDRFWLYCPLGQDQIAAPGPC